MIVRCHRLVQGLCWLLLMMIPGSIDAQTIKINLLIPRLYCLPGSDIRPTDERLIRSTLARLISENPDIKFKIQADTLNPPTYAFEPNVWRSIGQANAANFVLTGQLDLIGGQSWLFSFNLVTVTGPGGDTTINADAQRFSLEGPLTTVLQTGVLADLAHTISEYMYLHRPKIHWWQQPRYWVTSALLGVSLTTYGVYAWYQSTKSSPAPADPDLPGPPPPPR